MKKIFASFLSVTLLASALLFAPSPVGAGGGGACENGNESDGHHILCQGNTIIHTPSGLLLRVEKVTPDSITLSVFPATPKQFRLQEGQSKIITSETTGEVVQITYIQYVNPEIILELETLTKPVLTIAPYAMSSTQLVPGAEQTVAKFVLSTEEKDTTLCLEVIGLTFETQNVSFSKIKLFQGEGSSLINVGEGNMIVVDDDSAVFFPASVCVSPNEPTIIVVTAAATIVNSGVPAAAVFGINYYVYTDDVGNYFFIEKKITASVVTYN